MVTPLIGSRALDRIATVPEGASYRREGDSIPSLKTGGPAGLPRSAGRAGASVSRWDSVGERSSATSMEGVVEDWTSFDVRASGPPMSAVEPFIAPPEVQPAINDLLVELQQSLAEPVRGITCDGTVTPGLFTGTADRTSTAKIRESAAAFLGSLGADDALAARFPIDAEEWRTWFNVHQYVFRHGVMLGNLSSVQRDLALGLVRATLFDRWLRAGQEHHATQRLALRAHLQPYRVR